MPSLHVFSWAILIFVVMTRTWIMILLVFLIFFSSFLVSQSFFARVFSSVFNARYSDCCVIAFCTCFLEHFCKCVAGIFKLCIFLMFSRFKLTWYRDWFCTYFVVYFDDLAYFYTTQLARLCADFRFIEFFLMFLIVFMSITWRHFECTCSMGVWKYSFSRVFRALLVVLHVFSRLFWLLAGCLAMAGLAGWLLGGYLDDGFGLARMSVRGQRFGAVTRGVDIPRVEECGW